MAFSESPFSQIPFSSSIRTIDVAVPVTGVSATFQLGSVIAGAEIKLDVSGVSATFELGTPGLVIDTDIPCHRTHRNILSWHCHTCN